MSQVSDYYKELTMNVFQRTHAHKVIKISVDSALDTVQMNPFYKINNNLREPITIESNKLALMMLRTFGPLMQKLELALRFTEMKQRKVIHEHVSKYCSDSLLAIQLDGAGENELEEFPTPFKKVEEVKVSRVLNTDDGQFTILNVFPAVRQLWLEHITEFDGFMLQVTIPTLEDVHVINPFSSGFEIAMEMFLRKNPQIQSLSLLYPNSLDCLQIASKYLKNLEKLCVHFGRQRHFSNGEIHFENLKKLTAIVDQQSENNVNIVTFDHLEELDLICHSIECVYFVGRNPNLKTLKITAHSINDDQIVGIGKTLKGLTEFSIKNEHEIEAETIVRFTQEAQQLTKLKLTLPGDTLYQTLHQHFSRGGWQIRKEGNNIFIEQIS